MVEGLREVVWARMKIEKCTNGVFLVTKVKKILTRDS